MPTIATLDGIKVHIFGLDHPPPHVHFFSPDFKLKLEIETGNIIAGTAAVGAKREKMIKRWVATNRQELQDRWDLGSRGEAIPTM